jgi:hypothetical protein
VIYVEGLAHKNSRVVGIAIDETSKRKYMFNAVFTVLILSFLAFLSYKEYNQVESLKGQLKVRSSLHLNQAAIPH